MNTSITRKRKYKLNVDFFKVWSHDMAYILGFITADGCIYRNTLSICLKNDDISILEYIKNNIAPDLPVKEIYQIDKKRNKKYFKCRIDICSINMIADLKFLNIVERKTGKEKIPDNIPENYIPDYIRGLFDGDGSVGKDKTHPLYSSICSASKTFLDSLSSITKLGKVYKGTNNIWVWRLSTEDSLLFRNIIYNNEPFSLFRKKQIFFSFNEQDFIRRRYSEYENDIIINSYLKNISLKDISKKINRSIASIKRQACILGVTKQKRPLWTEEEHCFMMNNFDTKNPSQSIKYISKTLGKTEKSVNNRVTRYKIRSLRKKRND